MFHAADAEEWRRRGDSTILCRVETSPEDIRGIEAAEGILTARGGMTSHAALVARQLGTVCVVGCEALSVDYRAGEARIGGVVLKQGDWLSLDGSTGEVIQGQLLTHPSDVLRVLLDRNRKAAGSPSYRRFAKLMRWVDETRRLGVRPTPTFRSRPGSAGTSAPRASACAAPSTCSSRSSASTPSAR